VRLVELRSPPVALADHLQVPAASGHQRARTGEILKTDYFPERNGSSRNLPEFSMRPKHRALPVVDTEKPEDTQEAELEPPG